MVKNTPVARELGRLLATIYFNALDSRVELFHSASMYMVAPSGTLRKGSLLLVSLRVAVVICLILCLGCRESNPGEKEVQFAPGNSATSEALPASLISLLANPRDYHGKEVVTVGVLSTQFEGVALYFHREDYDHRLVVNSIWLELPEGSRFPALAGLEGRYVSVLGHFDADRHGHLG